MVELGPLSPPGSIDLRTGASITPDACRHLNTVPVELLDTGEAVAKLCPDCDAQLPADWPEGYWPVVPKLPPFVPDPRLTTRIYG